MEILYVLVSICIVISIVGVVVALKSNKKGLTSADKTEIADGLMSSIKVITDALTSSQSANNQVISLAVENMGKSLGKSQQSLENRTLQLISQLDERMQNMAKSQEEKLEAIRQSNERNIKSLQEDNNKQLDKMRETVDEKLSKTINQRFDQSFKVLGDQLEKVYKSIGEMQTMATDVGSLTKMLSNVKTAGIFGEIQLGAILQELLNADQYEQNIVTGSAKEPVEFAIKLPGTADGECVYLPIDSKFPYTVYTDLQDAYEKGDKALVKDKQTQLKNTVRKMAKDIKTKYINPPKTTAFAVMFLPIEGLYAEVIKLGLMEELQRSYNVTIAGPTTMSALLNSYKMGFRTLAIQKKSGEVWKILSAVKTEFETFSEVTKKIQDKFNATSEEFEKLVGVRTRKIYQKLSAVESLDKHAAQDILKIDDTEE